MRPPCSYSAVLCNFLGDKMSRVFLAMLVVILSGCSSIQKYPQFAGGEKVSAPGFDFNLPPGDSWSLVKRNGYPIIFAREGKYPDESYIIGITRFELPSKSSQISKDDFVSLIKDRRSVEEEPGRYEVISNHEKLDSRRNETCLVHHSVSKDNNIIRAESYTILETFGMNCIDPVEQDTGVFFELSRKAPVDVKNQAFESQASSLLESVKFPDLNDPFVKVYYSRKLIEKGNPIFAEKLAEEAAEIFERNNDYVNAGSAYTSLGVLYDSSSYHAHAEYFREQGSYDSTEKKSISFYEKAIKSYKKGNDYWGAANAFVGIGDLYSNKGEIKKSCAAYTQGLNTFNARNKKNKKLVYTWNPKYPSYAAMLEGLIEDSCRTSMKN